MTDKPRVFIGSSVESIDIAHTIQELLEHDALCKVWDQGIFELSGNALDNLLKATREYDFAIFVFQADDITKIRDIEYQVVRDNIIFELGLFIGKLGKSKVFFLIPRNIEKLHLPTDLLGVIPGQFDMQSSKNDLLAALGPFCNKVRRQIQDYIIKESIRPEEERTLVKPTLGEGSGSQKKEYKFIENGIDVDSFGNYRIKIEPTVFFSYRMAKAFPGIRGLIWFNNPKEALDRLEILLRSPLKFEKASGNKVSTEPIWWFRGTGALSIPKFKRISENKCLMDVFELDISRIAVYHSESYWQSFVYVEAKKEPPTGIYKYSKQDIEESLEVLGYVDEEYGLYEGIPITRRSYDDGAAVIGGKVIDTSNAEFRVRYLSEYNFIIASRFASLNCKESEGYLQTTLNNILRGKDSVENMTDYITSLKRNRHDF